MAFEKDEVVDLEGMSVLRCIYCRALTGKNIRAYLQADLHIWKRQIAQITQKETFKYEACIKQIHKDMTNKINSGVSCQGLKSWCAIKNSQPGGLGGLSPHKMSTYASTQKEPMPRA